MQAGKVHAGPATGDGQMIKVTSWHAIFWLLAIVGTLMLMSLFWLAETLPPEKRSQASVTRAFHNHYALLTNARYMRVTLCLTFCYVAAYAFITGSPFVYITYFGVDPRLFG